MAYFKKVDERFYVTSSVLAVMFGVTQRHILNHVKEGMPKVDGAGNWYDLRECFKWYFEKEVETRFSKITVDDLDDDDLSEAQVDIALKKARTKNLQEDTEIKNLKKLILDGVYVKADELDRNMAELAGIFISAMKDMRATLPKILSNRTEEEIIRIMDTEFDSATTKIERGIFAEEEEEDDGDL